MRDILGRFYFYFSLFFYILGSFLIRQVAFVGNKMVIANSAPRAFSTYHLTANARSWNNS